MVKSRVLPAGLATVTVAGALQGSPVVSGEALQQSALPPDDLFSGVTPSDQSTAPVLVDGTLVPVPLDGLVSKAVASPASPASPSRIDLYLRDNSPDHLVVPLAWAMSDSTGAFELRSTPGDLPPYVSWQVGEVFALRMLISSPVDGGFATRSLQAKVVEGASGPAWELQDPESGLSAEAQHGPTTYEVPAVGQEAVAARSASDAAAMSSLAAGATPSTCRPKTATIGGIPGYPVILNQPDASINWAEAEIEDVNGSWWQFSASARQETAVSLEFVESQEYATDFEGKFGPLAIDVGGSYSIQDGRGVGGGSSYQLDVGPYDNRKLGGTFGKKFVAYFPAWLQMMECRNRNTGQYESAYWAPDLLADMIAMRGAEYKDSLYLTRVGQNNKYFSQCENSPTKRSYPYGPLHAVNRSYSSSFAWSNGYSQTYTGGVAATGEVFTPASASASAKTETRTGGSSSSTSSWTLRNMGSRTKYVCSAVGQEPSWTKDTIWALGIYPG